MARYDRLARFRISATPIAAVLAAATACAFDADGFVEPVPCALPAVSRSTLMENPANVLSVFVATTTHGADSVVVRFGENVTLEQATPAMAATPDSLLAPVLGLRPQTVYRAQVVAFNRCGASTGDTMSFTTGALPADLPAYSATGSNPAPGYVVFAAGKYGLAIDNTGRVVWYHRFENGPGLNFQPQPNARYAARPPAASGEIAAWVEIDPTGTITRRLGCAGDLAPRLHDFIALPDGSYWMMCDELRTVDLAAQGASPGTRVLGTSIQRRSATGQLLFNWSPFDHLPIELNALESSDVAGASINWTHGNSIDLDHEGNLLVSFRNLSEIIRIDTRSGAVLWRMGGARNQFSFANGGVRPFARQHGVRSTGSGNLVLLDNLGEASGSRVEHYRFDEHERSARLTASYTSTAQLVAQIGGNTQALHGGHTLVSFGNGGGVEEYDASGRMVWKLEGDPGYVFRAQRIRSLYHPGAGDPR